MADAGATHDWRLDDVEFTHEWYRGFLRHLDAEGVRFRRYAADLAPGDALVRHDVDLSPDHAVEMAHIEADLGVHATYFFLVSTPLYSVHNRRTRTAIEEIADLGHDVGLHFSTHQHWEDDPGDEAVERAVERERTALATVADPIETVSFHAPPDWVLAREFDGFPSAYAPRFFHDVAYCSDSDQRWRDDPPLTDGVPDRLQVLVHPGLWGERDRSFDACVRRATANRCEHVQGYAASCYL